MKPLFALVLTALALAACDRKPPQTPTSFERNGHAYQWNMAGVPGRTGLYLSAMEGVDRGRIVFTISCTDPGYGGLTLRFGALTDGPLSVEAEDQTFAVASVRKETGKGANVTGESYFPDGWYKSLGRADQIVVSHGRDRWTFAGPGEHLVRRFNRLCLGRRL